MKYKKLGRSGLNVSRICLGTMNFGSGTSKEESFKIMDAALDAGVNFFDTANNYGFLSNNQGITEKIMGEWFAQGGGRREKVVLATKVHEDMFDPNDGPNSEPGLSIYKIRRHFEASLKRLQTDHVELFYMHHIDRSVTPEEMWPAFERLFNQGLIDYVGTSNFPAWQLARYQGEAKMRHFIGTVVEQDKYNLMERRPEMELLPAVEGLGLGFTPWSPMNGGLLAGDEGRNDPLKRGGLNEQTMKQIEAYSKLCKEAGIKEAHMALAWLLADERVTSPMVGPGTVAQFEDTLKAVEIELTPDILEELDRIFPGPGESPENYGW
ncbi:MAG: aldo/keto reductase [Turicibacter sp.]|nr:aldo/keto reductase [Turicibacter sp.]